MTQTVRRLLIAVDFPDAAGLEITGTSDSRSRRFLLRAVAEVQPKCPTPFPTTAGGGKCQ